MALILTGAAGSSTLDSSAGLTFSDSSNQSAAASPFGLKNRIINGAMVIDQRNAGASVTPSTIYTQYTLDRWFALYSVGSKFSVQQNAASVTPPAGFTNYLGATSLATTSLGSTDFYQLDQAIEGYNMADLAWGTANAKTVTLSFWVRSSLTGTFGGSLRNNANDRSYPFSYTISAANTWEYKTITIAGDTTGTWLTTNGVGILLGFNLGTGSTYSGGTANTWNAGNYITPTGATSVVGTNGATFYITGVQLERNTTATPFEWRPYGMELALCQRYLPCFRSSGTGTSNDFFALGQAASATILLVPITFPVTTRVRPTGITINDATKFIFLTASGSPGAPSAIIYNSATTTGALIYVTVSSLAAGNSSCFGFSSSSTTSDYILFNGCEL